MNSAVKKIVIILGLIILLPVAFLVFNELSTLDENEQVLEKIYNDQLQAILFSVNQYSADVVGSWANNISDILNSSSGPNKKNLYDDFFKTNISIEIVFVKYSDEGVNDEIYFKYDRVENDSLTNLIFSTLQKNQKLVDRLFIYEKGGYRKLEPLNDPAITNLGLILFTESNSNKKRIIGIAINQEDFISRVLSSRLQEVAKNDFIITCRNPRTGFEFNSLKEERKENIQMEKAFWLFPEYSIGIALIGKTIKDLVNERAIDDIILIAILFIVLVGAVFFVYRTVKKEVELAQIKADFVSNVSHELRTPLALISMFAETLELNRVKSEEKKKEYYSIISQETNRLGRIVNAILNFSKTEAGKRKYNFAEADINELTEQVFNTYNFHLHNKGFEFQFIKNENLPYVTIDSEAISEAIINLIDNAVKYSNDKKEVNIKTGSSDGFVFVEITDKGVGISQDDQKKIFDKFYRVSTGSTHSVKGTGLGLSLVKHIVEAHSGKIMVESKPNEGSSFKILLPVS